MPNEQLQELLNQYRQTKDKQVLNQIMDILNPLITKGVRTFGGGGDEAYLNARARLIVKRAIDNYDPKKGRLENYIMLSLQELRRRAAESKSVLSSSEYMRLQQKKLYESEKELEDRLGRPPSDQELADYLGVSLSKISRLRSAQGGSVGSSVGEMAVKLPQFGELNEAQRLWLDTVYLDASPEDKVIMEHYFGLRGRKPATFEEIAKRLKKSIGYVHGRVQKINNELSLLESLR